MMAQKIALAVVTNEQGEILLTQRKKNTHLAGLWEFPGGKLDQGESFKQALRRELAEEIGITLASCRKLINFKYNYPDRQLHLQVFQLSTQQHEVTLKEHQAAQWLQQTQLSSVALPAANQIILNALRMPDIYAIADHDVFASALLDQVEQQLKAGIRLLQYRVHGHPSARIITSGRAIKALCDRYGATMVLNSEWRYWDEIEPHGVHIKSADLARMQQTPAADLAYRVISASCHTPQQAELINSLDIAAVLVGPVQTTLTHPQQRPVGWIGFSKLCARINRPVYAIGGCRAHDVATAQVYGGHGIAAIRGVMQSY